MFKLTGGLASFVKPGMSVLVKPNLLSDRTPERAVTTHPEVVRAVIREVKSCRARPFIADSPSHAVKLERVWRETGMGSVAEQENIPLVSLEKEGVKTVEHQDYTFRLARPVLDADFIINIPKVKTHVLTRLTAAVKNTYGFLPGYQKTRLHAVYPTPTEFGNMLRALCSAVGPGLNIADGIIAMEGKGPSGGSPVTLGLLAVSSDAQALDTVLCRVLGISPGTVPYLARQSPYDSVKTTGSSLEDLQPDCFALPPSLPRRLIPGALVRLISPLVWIRPRLTGHCVECGRCMEACPVGALTLPSMPREAHGPEIDSSKCIGCCCCTEVCPENALTMTRSPLLKLGGLLKMQ
ncbi:MAG: DUF362 domain-containing protein [Kiritimatiellia bacterium]